jgi:acetyl esterase/lipase
MAITPMTGADLQSLPMRAADHRLSYGEDSNQIGELRLPSGNGPHPIVVLVHGGCWKAEYASLRDLAPMGDALKDEGIATWNVEYRRLPQPGSGWPGTYLDVGRAIDHLRVLSGEYHLDLSRAVALGHSAGGHLALWASARQKVSKTSPLFVPEPLVLSGVMNLAGMVDMRENIAHYEAECGDAVVTSLLGGPPAAVPDHYSQASASTMLPLGVAQILIWGEHDNFVPRAIAEQYAHAASQAGDRAELLVVPGVGHFETASPASSAWPHVRGAIRSLLTN